MKEAARVSSLEALGQFRAWYAEFGEQSRLALSNAESDVRRVMWWLGNDRLRYWQMQIKKREKLLAQARAELHSAELSSSDLRPSLVLERKAVQKATRGVEEAKHKIEMCKKWARVIEREYMLYKGQTAGLSGRLERDVPKGLARLAALMDHLDKYIRMNPDATHAPAAPTPSGEQAGADDDDTTPGAGPEAGPGAETENTP